jgi:hypothetical protein
MVKVVDQSNVIITTKQFAHDLIIPSRFMVFVQPQISS